MPLARPQHLHVRPPSACAASVTSTRVPPSLLALLKSHLHPTACAVESHPPASCSLLPHACTKCHTPHHHRPPTAHPRSFGKTYLGKYSDQASVPQAAAFYPSSNYYDDLSVAASWLYQATGEGAYLTEAVAHYATHLTKDGYPWNNFGWDTNSWAAAILLAKITGQASYATRVQVRQLQQFRRPEARGRTVPPVSRWVVLGDATC